MYKKISAVISILLVFLILLANVSFLTFADNEAVPVSTEHSAADFGTLLDTTNQFIVVKHKSLGGSHYAYTEGVSDETGSVMGNELNFDPGSQMVLLTLEDVDGVIYRKEEVLIDSKSGVLRDPDVSEDGTAVIFSWKQDRKDDFHLYKMDISTKSITQLTFGSGIADIEPKYLPGGKIVFSSTRCIEYVDCWITPVSNMYMCDSDGTNIIRVGYDQVHTTYPTVTEDGRVLYTRWDYNDRTQMYIQGVFQMSPDGTNQTEVFGNNSSFPTTLLHTREVPGNPGLYVSISSGHHTWQGGKLVLVDTSKGRNNKDSVTFVFPDSKSSKKDNEDAQNQSGPIYKYPVALNNHEFLVSYSSSGWSNSDKRGTKFGIYYMNSETNDKILISPPEGNYGASQIAPIKKRTLHERASGVNYSSETGTYYVANVYEGEGMKGVEPGSAKYLRVVALEFRSSSIGATVGAGVGTSDQFSPVATGNGSWDVKRVLGIVEVEEDGSALFKVPANTPLYFQVLNSDGELIQSMRSWSTLMPNETFSCIGCHEDKNTTPSVNSTVTNAMKKGVQTLKPDLWMTMENEDTYDAAKDSKGFSYSEQVQPILDDSCISCHNNTSTALFTTGAKINDGESAVTGKSKTLFKTSSRDWKYYTNELSDNWYSNDYDDSGWSTGIAPFGDINPKTSWNSDNIYIRTVFTIDDVEALKDFDIILKIFYDENPQVYLNGELIYSENGYSTDYMENLVTESFMNNVRQGENVLAVSAINTAGGRCIDLGFYAIEKDGTESANNPVSLKSTAVLGGREMVNYNLSYLVLTASKSMGNQFQGTPENKYTNWISSMSQAEILEPYQFGSTKSPIIERLKSGHGDLNAKQIQTIAAWIDLGVPFRGSYDEANTWSQKEYKEYYEKLNKRAYYDSADIAVKQALSGKYATDTLDFTVKYTDKSGEELGSVTGSGVVKLNLDSKLSTGGTVTIELPEGVQYFFLNLDSRLSEALIYCPSGRYEYTIPSFAKSVFPSSVLSASNPVITVRLASDKDLTTERNLALNPYDLKDTDQYYPHASASNVYDSDNSPEFSARNAIDGFKNNKGHGNYPVQSWGPDENPSDLWYNIDFGKTVYVNSVDITIRADFPHDTHFTKVLLEFSDNTTQEVELTETSGVQKISIEGGAKATSYVKIRDFEKADSKWAALTEVEVFGTVNEVTAPVLEDINITSNDGDVKWNKDFSKDTYEYDISVNKNADSVKIKNIQALNADSIIVRVDNRDITYDGHSDIDINLDGDSAVKVILSGSGGSASYTFNIHTGSSSIWLIIGICAGALVIAVSVVLVLKFRGGKKNPPPASPVAEVSDTDADAPVTDNTEG